MTAGVLLVLGYTHAANAALADFLTPGLSIAWFVALPRRTWTVPALLCAPCYLRRTPRAPSA